MPSKVLLIYPIFAHKNRFHYTCKDAKLYKLEDTNETDNSFYKIIFYICKKINNKFKVKIQIDTCNAIYSYGKSDTFDFYKHVPSFDKALEIVKFYSVFASKNCLFYYTCPCGYILFYPFNKCNYCSTTVFGTLRIYHNISKDATRYKSML